MIVVNSGGFLDVDTTFGIPGDGTASGSVLEGTGPYIPMPGVFTITGAIVNGGGEMDVNAGGTAIDTTVNTSGLFTDQGLASGTVLSGGDMYVNSGGVAQQTTILAPGVETLDGGADFGAIINGGSQELGLLGTATATSATVLSGGYQDVVLFGSAVDTTVSSGGNLAADLGGTVSGALILSGGIEVVASGAIDYEANVFGSQGVFLNGVASGAVVVSGGQQSVFFGGETYGTVVIDGGMEFVGSAGIASGTVIDGGTLELGSGAVVSGGITFVGSGGTLILDDPAGFIKNFGTQVISGFVQGDLIDFKGVPYTSSGVALGVALHGATTDTLQLIENQKYNVNLIPRAP